MRAVSDHVTPRSRLFVSVGTDHHPFDRLVGWVADFARANPDWDVALQHGRTAAPPPLANLEAFAFCDHAKLIALFSGSDAVVSHGGPATITEARRTGHLPVVVPRDPSFGEHVDGHQMLFAGRLAGAGLVALAGSYTELDAAVHAARARRRAGAGVGAGAPGTAADGAAPVGAVPPGVHAVGRIAEEVVRTARSRRRRTGVTG